MLDTRMIDGGSYTRQLGVVPDGARSTLTAGGMAMGPTQSYGPNATPEQIAQAEWNRTAANAVPKIQQLAAGDNSINQAAEQSTANLLERTTGQIEQVNSRRLSKMSPAQQRFVQSALSREAASTEASVKTNAALAQRDSNDSRKIDAYNYANSFTNQGMGTLTGGTNMKMQREAQNKASSKGFMSSLLGVAGTVIGGIYGGPAGAAAGGAIGSAIGGS